MNPAAPPETDVEDEEKPSSTRAPSAQRPLVLLGVVALLVGLLGGFIAGFRVEQNRVWNRDAKTKAPTLRQISQKISRVGGVVTEAANGKITVAASTGFQMKMGLPSTLVVEKATKGSIADVTVGSRILQRGEQVTQGKRTGTHERDHRRPERQQVQRLDGHCGDRGQDQRRAIERGSRWC